MGGFAVAIDGPGGAGKSTMARMLAEELGLIYIDTGAMYRAVALFCLRGGIPFERRAVEARLDEVDISIRYVDGEQRVFLGGDDITREIRTQEVADGSSKAAAFPGVREKLVSLQRKLAQGADVVMDGRDIGTHVLPSASVKIYLDAGVEHRARRRQDELEARGLPSDFERVKAEVISRDERDTNREFSPLRRADGAVLVDTSGMSPGEVKDRLVEIIASRR